MTGFSGNLRIKNDGLVAEAFTEWDCDERGHRFQRHPLSDDFGVCRECGHEEREDA